MTYRLKPICGALAAAGLLHLGSARADFVLGPFQVTQQATLQSSSSLAATVVATGQPPQTIFESYFSATGQSQHYGFVPNGNRAFGVSTFAAGTVPLAGTAMDYDLTFTNNSSDPFTGGVSFLLWYLQMSNTCSQGALCDTTDPTAKAGASIAITTTRPGGSVTTQSFHAELGLNETDLHVLSDSFNLASQMHSNAPGMFALDTGPFRLRVNFGTVNPGEAVGISYDTLMYAESGDGLCNPPPVVTTQFVCDEFDNVSSGSSGGSVCISGHTEIISTPQPPFQCTSRFAGTVDPLSGPPDLLGATLDPARVPVPGTATLVSLGLAALMLSLRRRRGAAPPARSTRAPSRISLPRAELTP